MNLRTYRLTQLVVIGCYLRVVNSRYYRFRHGHSSQSPRLSRSLPLARWLVASAGQAVAVGLFRRHPTPPSQTREIETTSPLHNPSTPASAPPPQIPSFLGQLEATLPLQAHQSNTANLLPTTNPNNKKATWIPTCQTSGEPLLHLRA